MLKKDDVIAAHMVARGLFPFQFSIIVPKDWKVAKVSESDLTAVSPQPISIFESQSNSSVSFQVLGMILTNEISAAHWLTYYISKRKWISEELEEKGPRLARASVSFLVENTPMTALLSATVNGSTIILIQSVCPAANFADLTEIMNLGVSSFNTQQIANPNIIEPWNSIELNETIVFNFIKSWNMRRMDDSARGRTAFDFLRVSPQDEVLGLLRVKSIERNFETSLEESLALTTREFGDAGIQFVESTIPQIVDAASPWLKIATVQAKGKTNPENLVEYEAYAFQHNNGIVIVGYTGPHFEFDYYNWAINRRAFDIATASLTIRNE